MLGTYWSPFKVIYEASSYPLIIAYWGFYLKASIAAIKTTDQSISTKWEVAKIISLILIVSSFIRSLWLCNYKFWNRFDQIILAVIVITIIMIILSYTSKNWIHIPDADNVEVGKVLLFLVQTFTATSKVCFNRGPLLEEIAMSSDRKWRWWGWVWGW